MNTKTLFIPALLLLTAACGSSVESSQVASSTVTAQSANAVCAWVYPEYDFHTYDSAKATTPPSNLEGDLYWKIEGTADSVDFVLYLTVDQNNVPWISVVADGNTEQVACANSMTVGSATIQMESLANGYLFVRVNNSDGTTRQYMNAGFGYAE